jgi:AcrR family transcriptional regulator
MTTATRSTGQQRRSVRTREHILAMALSTFARQGYAETSMEDICRESGCSKGGLYHHFPTKEAVLLGVIGRLRRLDGLQPPVDVVAAATGLPEAGLSRLLLDLWSEAARSAKIRALLVEAGDGEAPLVALLRIGALVQGLTLGTDLVDGTAHERLGIPRAA